MKNLIVILFLVIPIALKSQSFDTIRIEKKGIRTVYYQGSEELNIKQIKSLVETNEEATKFMRKANNLQIVGLCFWGGAGYCIGYPLGHALGRSISGNKVKMKEYIPMFGLSACFIACAISFDMIANKKIKQGINVFNNSKRQNNDVSLDLGFSTNGLTLKLKL